MVPLTIVDLIFTDTYVTASIEVLIQVLNVGGIKFGDTWLILPTAKLNSKPYIT